MGTIQLMERTQTVIGTTFMILRYQEPQANKFAQVRLICYFTGGEKGLRGQHKRVLKKKLRMDRHKEKGLLIAENIFMS